MSDHITDWLNAYLDGKLQGTRLGQVVEHLASCVDCRNELDSLQRLTVLLRTDPEPEFPSPERFATQVNLLLPQKRSTPPRPQLFNVGWWVVPVGLMLAWAFVTTAVLLGNVVAAADQFGVLDRTTASWISGQPETTNLTAALGQFGFLKENSLQLAEWSESFTRSIFPAFIWYASIAFIYLVWIAVWWARQTHTAKQPVLES